jgi:hypothetical protein
MAANRTVTLTPINPPGASLTFALWGNATYKNASASTGVSGFQVLDRPRQTAAIFWYDRPLYEIDLPLTLTSTTLYGVPGESVEFQCLTLESWQEKVPGFTQPPVLNMTGPVPGQQRQWVVYTLAFGEAIRDSQAGFRTQQQVKVTLYEYIAPLVTTGNTPTPAQSAQQALTASSASQSYLLYTVRVGDSLASIAARFLGAYTKWTVLASLNNIRTPNNLTPGQVIQVPQN